MDKIELYHFCLCPYSRKIRLLLLENNIDFTLINEPFWERRRGFIKLNPTCETPMLLINNQASIWGNQTSTEYVLELHTDWATIDPIKKASIRKITEWFDHKFYHEVTKHIFQEKILKTVARQSHPNSQAIRVAKTNIHYHLEYIGYLCQKHQYLTGDNATLADFTAAAQLSVLDYVDDVPWASYPAVKEWYALLKSRVSLQTILKDKIPNFAPPAHYQNPDF